MRQRRPNRYTASSNQAATNQSYVENDELIANFVESSAGFVVKNSSINLDSSGDINRFVNSSLLTVGIDSESDSQGDINIYINSSALTVGSL